MQLDCPTCNSALVTTDIGLACPTCGQRVHYNHADSNAQGTHVRLDIQDAFGAFSDTDLPDRPVQPIINHHASSQYRKRLDKRLHGLEIPELEGPIASIKIEPTNTPDQILLDPIPEIASQLIVSTPSHTAQDSMVIATKPPVPLENTTESPLNTAEQALLQTALQTTRLPEVAATHHSTAAERAEALLAANASPQHNASSSMRKNWLLAGLSIACVAFGLSGAWLILKPSPPAPSPSPSAIAQVSPSLSDSPAASLEAQKRDKQRKADINSVAIGLEAYRQSTGSYPTGSSITILEPLTRTAPPYIEKRFADPGTVKTGDEPILYGYASDGASFTLSSVLENKADADARNGQYIVKNTAPKL